MLVRALLCFSLAVACAKQEAPVAGTQNIHSSEAVSPAKHFRMTGEIVFRNEGYSDVSQQGELWLGSDDRMRFSVGTVDKKNIFIFDGEKGCWKKTPGSAFKEYPEAADNFGMETELRWHVLNMPWSENDSRFSLSLSDNKLPNEVSLGEYVVKLSGYKALGKRDALYPTVWHWTTPFGIRVETFSDLQDGALFLDSAFVPPNFSPLDSIRLAHADAESLADRVGIVTEDFFYIAEADFTRETELPKGWWWVNRSERYFVFDQQPEFQIENMKSITGKTWLRWATYDSMDDAFGSETLLKIVKQSEYSNTGEVWVKEVEDNSRRHLKVFIVTVVEN
jgi:hypothetical protein